MVIENSQRFSYFRMHGLATYLVVPLHYLALVLTYTSLGASVRCCSNTFRYSGLSRDVKERQLCNIFFFSFSSYKSLHISSKDRDFSGRRCNVTIGVYAVAAQLKQDLAVLVKQQCGTRT